MPCGHLLLTANARVAPNCVSAWANTCRASFMVRSFNGTYRVYGSVNILLSSQDLSGRVYADSRNHGKNQGCWCSQPWKSGHKPSRVVSRLLRSRDRLFADCDREGLQVWTRLHRQHKGGSGIRAPCGRLADCHRVSFKVDSARSSGKALRGFGFRKPKYPGGR